MEGYKPQDFSFFHRSEKLVQRIIIVVFSKLLGMETEAVRESIVWSILMSCLIIVILVPVCMFMNRKCKWVLGKS